MRELKGKVAAITGGASGIGLALAERFADAGMRIALADIEAAPLAAAAERLRAAGHDAIGIPTDVSSAESMDAFGERVLGELGGVHLVCNNAGVGGGGPMWELSTADWEFVLGVNLWGVIHGVRVFAKHLVAQREGHIVNTASMAGLVSVPGMGPYNVSKHGVVTLSETLHGELQSADAQVGVSVLCPGFVNTRIYDSGRNRPEALRNQAASGDSEEMTRRREMAAHFFSTAMPTAEVADAVHDAVLGDRFYVLTHDGSASSVETRMKTIVEGGNPPVAAATIFNAARR